VPKQKTTNIDFEKSLTKLETLVEKMEHGDLSLEQSLKSFEEGIKLTSECNKALTDAEQKVEILIKEQGFKTEPFESLDDE
jgi:exodeoxyribonuclease VII small subunit